MAGDRLTYTPGRAHPWKPRTLRVRGSSSHNCRPAQTPISGYGQSAKRFQGVGIGGSGSGNGSRGGAGRGNGPGGVGPGGAGVSGSGVGTVAMTFKRPMRGGVPNLCERARLKVRGKILASVIFKRGDLDFIALQRSIIGKPAKTLVDKIFKLHGLRLAQLALRKLGQQARDQNQANGLPAFSSRRALPASRP